MRLRPLVLTLVAIALSIGSAAQDGPSTSQRKVVATEIGAMAMQGRAGVMTMEFEGMDAEPVKGAPFCANISTEHTQLFADGNRIHTTGASTLCRDGDGRIRRESEVNLLGAVPQHSPGKLITIIDPVAGVRYVLDPNEKIARKMPTMPKVAEFRRVPPGTESAPAGATVYHVEGPSGGGAFNTFYVARNGNSPGGATPKSEALGDQTISGVHATGTRITTTIPAGQMGNDEPILVTSERWYSPELKATVMTKHSDPWAGELKTQFTSVTTSEPDPSLFTVPPDYKVVEERLPFVIRQKTLSSSPE